MVQPDEADLHLRPTTLFRQAGAAQIELPQDTQRTLP
jgi:hypothetical protein